MTGHPRVAAAVEATRRLAATTEDAALAAALCGPAQLAAQLGRPPDPAALEDCGAVLLALAKAFLEAGAHLLLVVEAEPVSRPAVRRLALRGHPAGQRGPVPPGRGRGRAG